MDNAYEKSALIVTTCPAVPLKKSIFYTTKCDCIAVWSKTIKGPGVSTVDRVSGPVYHRRQVWCHITRGLRHS